MQWQDAGLLIQLNRREVTDSYIGNSANLYGVFTEFSQHLHGIFSLEGKKKMAVRFYWPFQNKLTNAKGLANVFIAELAFSIF